MGRDSLSLQSGYQDSLDDSSPWCKATGLGCFTWDVDLEVRSGRKIVYLGDVCVCVLGGAGWSDLVFFLLSDIWLNQLLFSLNSP